MCIVTQVVMEGAVKPLTRFMNTLKMKKNVYFVAQVAMEGALRVLMVTTNMVMGIINANFVGQDQEVVVQKVHTVSTKHKTKSILFSGQIL